MIFTRQQILDQSGSRRTQSLFLETNKTSSAPLMTLKSYEREHAGTVLPSLYEIYMDFSDPTEYEVAMHVLGSWDHWTRLFDNTKIMAYIQSYRDELEIKIRSSAVKVLIQSAENEGAKGISAAKYIAEKGWDKRKAGAPSKEEKVRQSKVDTRITDEVDEDLERLGITYQ